MQANTGIVRSPSRTWLILVAGAFMHMGCGQDVEELGERGLLEESPQHASYAQVDDDTPAGYLDFYSGAAARKEFEELGRFVPEPTKTWTRVRVPQELVTLAETTSQTVTVSICNPDFGISLVVNRAGTQYKARIGVTNCTPWVVEDDGRWTATLTSGMEGLFGTVQIGLDQSTSQPFVTALVSGRLESACPDGGQSDAAMVLGAPLADDSPDDPMLASCTIPESYE